MPANSFSGNRDVVAVVNALSSWDFDRTVTYAEVINVPSGGTLLQLPDNPRDGDYYEWANPDNTVTALDPIELALSAAAITAGVTIQRAASQLFTTPGTSGKVVFFDEANTWQLFLSASGGGGGGGATILNVTTTAMTGGIGPSRVPCRERRGDADGRDHVRARRLCRRLRGRRRRDSSVGAHPGRAVHDGGRLAGGWRERVSCARVGRRRNGGGEVLRGRAVDRRPGGLAGRRLREQRELCGAQDVLRDAPAGNGDSALKGTRPWQRVQP